MMTLSANGGLRRRLLTPITATMVICIGVMALAIISVQKRLLGDMGAAIESTVDGTREEIQAYLQSTGGELQELMAGLSATAGEELADAGRSALERERLLIADRWEQSLREHMEALADLLARVAPAAILSKNYVDLISYAKSASSNPDIVYAIYYRDDGKPLTRHLNLDDPIIKSYLETGEGSKRIDKVREASLRDGNVFIIEKPVALDGTWIGSVALCVSKASTRRHMEALGRQFDSLIADNTRAIGEVMAAQSAHVKQKMGEIFTVIGRENEAAIVSVNRGIGESLREVGGDIQLVIAGLGGGTVAIIFLLLFRSLTKVSATLRDIVDKLGKSAEQASAAYSQISATSQSLSQNASEQAANVETTSTALDEMAAMSRETENLTQGAEELMNENIRNSGQTLKALTGLTLELSEAEADGGRIGQIIKTIDEIAFQTNLLALNAAVEAARAGEAGAGFAVVADEVRNLAIRATTAAKDTQELLDGTIGRITLAARQIKDVNEDFESIIESATVMGEKTTAITEASREQADRIEQIRNASQEIDTAAQQTAKGAEEAATSADDLSRQAEEITGLVATLAHIVEGGRRESGGGPRPEGGKAC